MTIFFFVVGLEIKRELVTGELRDRSRAALPAVAAIGGMVVPALIYVAVNIGGDGTDGWAIPMATDIAFAVGVLAILGARVPSSLKVFLLTLAIVDDIGAIVVIALFYSSGVEPLWLVAGAVVVLLVVAMSRLHVDRSDRVRHPRRAALAVPVRGRHRTPRSRASRSDCSPRAARDGVPVLERLELWLHPVSSFVIVPLFALANAGVLLTGGTITDALASRVTLGIVAGLVVGKFVGILGASALGGAVPDRTAARRHHAAPRRRAWRRSAGSASPSRCSSPTSRSGGPTSPTPRSGCWPRRPWPHSAA